VAFELCAVADGDADLVVMAARQRTPLGSLLRARRVGRSLRRHLNVPWVLTKGAKTSPELFHYACRRILVPLDGSAAAESVLPPTIALARLWKAEITLLRVVKFRRQRDLWDAGDVASVEDFRRRKDEAERYLQNVSSVIDTSRVRIVRRVLVDRRFPGRAIADWAQDHEFDLIALAANSRRGVKRLSRRSVAGYVMRSARQPVLAVRADGTDGVANAN
jgi:nucleotide-binding universal stress UspA family protein